MLIASPIEPMEAETVEQVPESPGWLYEPKWDGFRCIAVREGDAVALWSKSGQPLGRYFPDIVAALSALQASRFVLDGELTVPVNGQPSFDAIQLRLHPAASQVHKLAAEHPALLLAFDLLSEDGETIAALPLSARRPRLEAFAAANFKGLVRLSPATGDRATALAWFAESGGGLDGVIAKKLDAPYAFGSRRAMVKYKAIRTADCVIGGFRYGSGGKAVGSLLLGLYDQDGLLHHVGFTSGLRAAERARITSRLTDLGTGPGFTGRAPGGPSRWSGGKDTPYVPLPHELVVEVSYDHVTGERFRHGTNLRRWRRDKSPKQCRLDQLDQASGSALALLLPRPLPHQQG